jgi:hypothetical protein
MAWLPCSCGAFSWTGEQVNAVWCLGMCLLPAYAAHARHWVPKLEQGVMFNLDSTSIALT